MPQYQKWDAPWMTVGASAAVDIEMTWENIPNVGPNQGPLLIMADPKPHQAAEVRLVTSDFTKCRRAPGVGGKTEVFYHFTVRNLSNITASYDVEIIDFKDLMGNPS